MQFNLYLSIKFYFRYSLLSVIVLCLFATLSCSDSNDTNTDGDIDLEIDNIDSDFDKDIFDTEKEVKSELETEGEVEAEWVISAACTVDADSIDGGKSATNNYQDIAFDEEMFDIGIQAGSMTDSQVILWTHTTDNLPKQLHIWRNVDTTNDIKNAENIKLVLEMTVTPKEGFIKENIDSLAPGTIYYYTFLHEDGGNFVKRSMIGRFRTAIADTCNAPVTIGGTHGTNKHVGVPYSALELSSHYNLDAFIHLGDFAYNYGATDTQGYRKEWKRTLVDPMIQVSMARTGHYIVWDDHEIIDNAELYDLPPEHLAAGKNAFFEHTPVPLHENGSYWRSYRWGETVEFFALDCRHERISDSCALRSSSEEYDKNTYISEEQMNWLKIGLKDSKAHFKVVLSSVPITKFPKVWDVALCDRWQGYPSQRNEILDHIADQEINNVWWLTGDFHTGTLNRIELEGPRRNMWEIMMGPGGNKNNPMWVLYAEELMDAEKIAPVDQFRFFGGNYMATMLTFDPQKDSVHVVFLDGESGETLYDEWVKEED